MTKLQQQTSAKSANTYTSGFNPSVLEQFVSLIPYILYDAYEEKQVWSSVQWKQYANGMTFKKTTTFNQR